MQRANWKKGTGHFRFLDGRFNKQGDLNCLNFYEAYLEQLQDNRSPPLPARILKVYRKALPGLSHSPDGLNSTLLSQGCILENASHRENRG